VVLYSSINSKGPDHRQRVLHRNQEKADPFKEEKVLFHQDNAPCHESIKPTPKLHELGYEFLPHPLYSPDLAPSDIFC
jgi:hypothetical protein